MRYNNALTKHLMVRQKFADQQNTNLLKKPVPKDIEEEKENLTESSKAKSQKSAPETKIGRYGSFLCEAQLSQFMFKSMQAQGMLECHSRAKKAFCSESKMNRKSQVHEILFINNQFLVCLLENGRCSIHQICKSN